MSELIDTHVSTKLFAGYVRTSEVSMHLKKSNAWQNAKVTPIESELNLIEIHYEKIDYIGYYLKEDKITLQQLKEHEELISQKMQLYCPQLNCSRLKFIILSQFFIQ